MEREEIDPEKARMASILGGEAVAMVAAQEGRYDAVSDAKKYAGLMTLDQIKAKRARIESGEETESEAKKVARAKRADDVLTAKEAQERAARLLAKKEKQLEEVKDEKPEVKTADGVQKKSKKKKASGTSVLSFDADED